MDIHTVSEALMLFNLYRLYINGQGYDSTGAYWGIGAPLYQYSSVDNTVELAAIRAPDREAAKVIIRRLHPNARFWDDKRKTRL